MFTRPKDKTILSFSGSPTVALARLLLESTPGVQCSETLLRSSPTLQTLQTLPPPPDHSPLFASIRWPGQAGLTSAGSVAAGSDGCLLGRIHFPCGYVVYVLLCCWGVFPVLTLYSPRSIVWGLFFSPPFPHVNAVFFFNSTCISLLIILVWLCMWRIIKNLSKSSKYLRPHWKSGIWNLISIIFFSQICRTLTNKIKIASNEYEISSVWQYF